ncbi:MAG: MFS transporter [Acidiferrobacterales bacterium]
MNHAIAVRPTLAMLAVLTIASMCSHSVAVLAPQAAPEIGVAATYIGAYVSIIFTSAMFSGVVTGAFISRYGAIRVCQLAILAAACGMVAFALSSPAAAVVSAVLVGMAHGPFNPASAHILIKVSTPRSRPLIFSIKQTGVPLGGALAGTLMPTLVAFIGWKSAALLVSALALIVLVVLQPMRRAFDVDRNPARPLSGVSIIAPLRLVFMHRALRPLAILSFAYAGCQLSVGGFFVVYLTQAVEMPLVQAGLVFALLQAAGVCGRILFGAIAGRVVSARLLLAVLGLVMAACMVTTAALTPSWPFAIICLLGIVLGASTLGWNGVNLAEIAARAPEGTISEVTGGVQFVMFLGIVIMPPSFGALVTLTGSYSIAFLVIAAVATVAGFYLMRSREPAARAVI